MIPRNRITIPNERIAHPIKDPNRPKGNPIIMKLTVMEIKESKKTSLMRVQPN